MHELNAFHLRNCLAGTQVLRQHKPKKKHEIMLVDFEPPFFYVLKMYFFKNEIINNYKCSTSRQCNLTRTAPARTTVCRGSPLRTYSCKFWVFRPNTEYKGVACTIRSLVGKGVIQLAVHLAGSYVMWLRMLESVRGNKVIVETGHAI